MFPNWKPVFEQITPSRRSGKSENAGGQIYPHWVLKGPKSAGFYRVKASCWRNWSPTSHNLAVHTVSRIVQYTCVTLSCFCFGVCVCVSMCLCYVSSVSVVYSVSWQHCEQNQAGSSSGVRQKVCKKPREDNLLWLTTQSPSHGITNEELMLGIMAE